VEEPVMDTHHMDAAFGLDHLRTDSPEPKRNFSQLDDAPAPTRPATVSSIRDSWVSESAFTANSPNNIDSDETDTDADSPTTVYSASSARSSYTSSCDTPATELSFTNSPISTAKTSLDLSGLEKPLPLIPSSSTKRERCASYAQCHLNFGTSTAASLNAGTYRPTGLKPSTYQPSGMRNQTPTNSFRPALSRYSSRQSTRDRSADSSCSSLYPEESLQAAEIEEEELRGRRRSRALDGIAKFSFGFELGGQ